MLRGLIAAAVTAAALAASGAGAQSAPYAVPAGTATGELAYRLLAAQNRERAALGHSPLVWDPALAASAASYGPTLARLHQLGDVDERDQHAVHLLSLGLVGHDP